MGVPVRVLFVTSIPLACDAFAAPLRQAAASGAKAPRQILHTPRMEGQLVVMEAHGGKGGRAAAAEPWKGEGPSTRSRARLSMVFFRNEMKRMLVRTSIHVSTTHLSKTVQPAQTHKNMINNKARSNG